MAFTARTAALGEQDAVLAERLDEVARQNGEVVLSAVGRTSMLST